jgi:hypothetical protein
MHTWGFGILETGNWESKVTDDVVDDDDDDVM